MFKQVSKVCESFLSKAVECIADNAVTNLKDIMDFRPILETLQKNMKSLIAKASDVEEQIKNEELSGGKKRKREVEEWLEEVKSIENKVVELGSQLESQGFIIRLMEGGTAAKLNEQVDRLTEQSRNFGKLALDVCGTRGEIFLTNELVGKAFEKNLDRIWELLEARQVSSIGVYGMGGVGKTTLVKDIYNRLLRQSQLRDRVLWVTVSQEFTIMSLQDKIARLLGVNLFDENEEDKRAARLHRALSQKKISVLILDDVWENIDMLKVGCPISVECCRLIITTRSLEVCRKIRCVEVLVKKLGEDEAWKLFTETLGKDIQLGRGVEKIAKSMAKICDGLPLGIITVAGSMRGETEIHTWKNALTELKLCLAGQDGMGEVEIFKVLKYSFDRLNRNHQSNDFNIFQLCFLYCSLYPEDHEIPREDLVSKFISEGFLHQRRSRRAQVYQGHCILDKLVGQCLLESTVNFGACVKMHDLVRGMAPKIGQGKYMVRAGEKSLKEITDEEEWTEDLEKVSLMKSGIRRIEDGISLNCPNLSTLCLLGNPLEFISDSFFSKMQGLCTLDLCETRIRELPDIICDMKSLKALLLWNCDKLEKVPYLGKLKALRELNLSGTAIEEVPQGVDELLNLKFLSLEADKLEMLPAGLLLKLGHLQHVNVPSHIPVPIEEIKNLKQLEEFSGGLENVNDFNCFITSWVQDTFYSIRVGSWNRCECNLKDAKVVWQGVVYLAMMKYEGMCICFQSDSSQSDYPSSLKRLEISGCGGIECILSSEQGLPSLKEIELNELEDLKGVIQKAEIAGASSSVPTQPLFSSLTRLVIGQCNKMRKLGLPVLQVPNLEEIDISECEEIEEIFKDEGIGYVALLKLKELSLHELPRLRKLGLPVVPNLEEIDIRECGELEEIFEDDGRDSPTLLKLEKLSLNELPRLRKLGLSVVAVPNIEEIDISECGEIEEIFSECGEIEDEGRGPVTLSNLQELSLHELPNLKSVWKETMICNSIETIIIAECPRLMKRLPVHVNDPPPPTLTKIIVEREWWNTMVNDNPNLPRLLHPFVYFHGSSLPPLKVYRRRNRAVVS